MSAHPVRLIVFAMLAGAAYLGMLPAHADVSVGANARATAMGGAGLASGDAAEAAAMNPAYLAGTGMRFAIQMPTVDASLDGASYGDVFKLLTDPSLSADDALDLAVDLGDGMTTLDASATTGLLLPQMDLQVNAAIRTKIVPNEEFRQWSANGGNGLLPAEARADVQAGGIMTLPSFGAGFRLPVDPATVGVVAVGVRVKPTKVYYSHYIIDADAVLNGEARPAPEMGDKSVLSESSWAADAGLLYIPASMPNTRFALVVNNLLEPEGVHFDSSAPETEFDGRIAPRSISLGAAYVVDYMTLAADLVDATSAFGDPQVRLGAEVRSGGGIALRGGYNSSSGFSAGLGYGNVSVAYSRRAPVMISHTIAF